MDKMTSRVSETNTSKKWREERRLRKEVEGKLRKAELQHKDDLDIIATQNTELLELNQRIKDLRERFEKGGVIYTVNNGYVSSAKQMLPFSEWTYDQPIPKEIGTKLYTKIPFYKIEDRQLVEDTKQKNKYLIIGGLI
jgi:hypothetical protein